MVMIIFESYVARLMSLPLSAQYPGPESKQNCPAHRLFPVPDASVCQCIVGSSRESCRQELHKVPAMVTQACAIANIQTGTFSSGVRELDRPRCCHHLGSCLQSRQPMNWSSFLSSQGFPQQGAAKSHHITRSPKCLSSSATHRSNSPGMPSVCCKLDHFRKSRPESSQKCAPCCRLIRKGPIRPFM